MAEAVGRMVGAVAEAARGVFLQAAVTHLVLAFPAAAQWRARSGAQRRRHVARWVVVADIGAEQSRAVARTAEVRRLIAAALGRTAEA